MNRAAAAVIRATLEDATTAELLTRPGMAAVRVALALERAGWTITPVPPKAKVQRPA